MTPRRKWTSTPTLQWGLGITGFVLLFVFYFRRSYWVFSPRRFMEYKWSFIAFAIIALFLFVIDFILAKREQALADRMYDFIGDVGQLATQGHGVESAIFHSAEARGGAASRLFNKALHAAREEPLPRALAVVGIRDGRPLIMQVTELVSVALAAGGAVGKMLHSLAERLAQVRQVERNFASMLNGKVFMLRFMTNVLFPTLFAVIATQQAYVKGYKWGAMFYLSVSLRIMTVDRLRLKSWRRAMAMQPFWLVLTTLCMQLGSNAMKNHVSDLENVQEMKTIPGFQQNSKEIEDGDLF